MGSLSSQLLVVTRQNVTTSQEKKAMNSTWKSSFGRSRTPMGTVPISVIYGYKYPLSPIPVKAGLSSSSYREASAWPSCLHTTDSTAINPPQVVPRRKHYQNGTTETIQKKTRGCLSYISSLRSKQETSEIDASTKPTYSSSFNASSYSY